MKNLTLLLIVCLAGATFLDAQTNKGKFLLGVSSRTRIGLFDLNNSAPDVMSLGYSTFTSKSDASGYDEPESDKLISLNFLPKVGYFVIDNLAIGLDINLAFMNYKFGGSNNEWKTTLYAAGPFARYYFPVGKVYPFVEAGATIGSGIQKSSIDSDTETYKSSVFAYGGGAGLAIPLGDKVTFDFLAGYNSTTIKDKDDNPDNERTVSGTFGIKFGFLVFIGK